MSTTNPPSASDLQLKPWRLALALAVVAALALAFWQVMSVIMLAFAGVLVAVLLVTCGNFLARWTHCSRRVGVTVTLIVMGAGLLGLGWAVAPALGEQFDDLREQLQKAAQQLDRWVAKHSGTLPVDDVNEISDEISSEITASSVWSRVAGIFSTTLGALSALAIAILIGVFLAYDPDQYISGILRIVPRHHRARVAEVLGALGHTLSRWLVSQLISMVFLAVSTWLALWLFGIPLALVLAVLTGIMTFVPYLGPIVALIPIVLVALVEGPMMALWVGLTYFVIQNIEGNVVMPLVYQRTVHLPPALTLIAQILLGTLVGIPGFMLATPLAAVALVALRMWYVQDHLGDDLERPVAELDAMRHARPPP